MFKGYKTVIFNVIMAIVAVVYALNPGAEVPDSVQVSASIDAFLTGLSMIWGIGNVILRAVTDSPIFKQTTEEKVNAKK